MEDPKIKTSAVISPQADKSKGDVSFLSVWLDGVKEKLEKFSKDGYRHIDICLINRILIVCIVLLSVFFVFNFYTSWMGLKRAEKADLTVPIENKQTGLIREISALKGLSYYIDGISKRNIFRMGGKLEEVQAVETSKLVELTQALKLVGISWSDQPDAMIEDSKAAQTFFVKKGQMIGEVQVENILKDKVVLRYGKDLIELK
jgi:hypothetical protein